MQLKSPLYPPKGESYACAGLKTDKNHWHHCLLLRAGRRVLILLELSYQMKNQQVIIRTFFIAKALFLLPLILRSQEVTPVNNPKVIEKRSEKKSLSDTKQNSETEIDFLFSYYDQDGIHSAVTGGIGTEELRDYSSNIIIHIPLDTVSRLNINTALNYYTSASTDNIDKDISSASSKDFRGQIYFTYTKEDVKRRKSYGFTGGGSSESDYLSTSLAFDWTTNSKDDNKELNLTAQIFFDKWLLIFPDELRGNREATEVQTDKRNSYQLSLTYSQILSKRIQASVNLDWVYQWGLLSTPFHRVYFQNESLPKIEKLPLERFKIPIGIRLHYFFSDFLLLRLYYRYYQDNFSIKAHSIEVESPLKFGNYFSLYPFYRFHSQSKSKYFAKYAQHTLTERYYSSDFDLSAFDSHKIGLGFRYSPLYGIGRFRLFSPKKITMLKSLEMRYAQYWRGDGLQAFVLSMAMKFLLK